MPKIDYYYIIELSNQSNAEPNYNENKSKETFSLLVQYSELNILPRNGSIVLR